MQHYVRLAGIEVIGATEALEIFDRSKEIVGGGTFPPPLFFQEKSNPLKVHSMSLNEDTSQAHDFTTTQV